MEKKLLIGLILTLIIIVFIPIYGVTEPARQQVGAERQIEQSAERGAETFLSVCSTCHGTHGEGAVGPALRSTRLDREVLVEVISKGRPAKPVAMPAWGQESGGPLKKHQIEDVANFIKNWSDAYIESAEAKHPAPATTKKETVSSESKEVAEGRTLFSSMGCAACHGPSGAGTAIAPDIAGKTRDEIIKQVRSPRTQAMPSFPPSRLSDDGLDNILAFIASLKK